MIRCSQSGPLQTIDDNLDSQQIISIRFTHLTAKVSIYIRLYSIALETLKPIPNPKPFCYLD